VIELHNYLSDISREQFEIIRLDLEDAKKKNVRAHTTCTMFFVRSRRSTVENIAHRFPKLAIGLLLSQSLDKA